VRELRLLVRLRRAMEGYKILGLPVLDRLLSACLISGLGWGIVVLPEALTVRATHYGASEWGDNDVDKRRAAEKTAVSKAAFELLHSRYPQSEWAKKTKCYY